MELQSYATVLFTVAIFLIIFLHATKLMHHALVLSSILNTIFLVSTFLHSSDTNIFIYPVDIYDVPPVIGRLYLVFLAGHIHHFAARFNDIERVQVFPSFTTGCILP